MQRRLKLVASNYQAHNRLGGVIYRDAGKVWFSKEAHYNAGKSCRANADSVS